jgi:hypothetical protein
MDVSALAAFLAPCLTFLLDTGRDVANRAANSLGEKVWERAKQLWDRLGPAVADRPAAGEAAADLAAAPDDPDARAALAWQLRKLLASDEALLSDVEGIWADAVAERTVVASGERSVAIGGDVSGSTVITGDQPRPPT